MLVIGYCEIAKVGLELQQEHPKSQPKEKKTHDLSTSAWVHLLPGRQI